MITRKMDFVNWITLATTLTMLAIATKMGIDILVKFACEFPWYF